MSDGAAPRVALTFDAEHPSRRGWHPAAPTPILDALAEAGVTATFFLQGRWVRAHPETARRIAEDGHLVGHHSHFHARLTLLSAEGVRTDVACGTSAINEITGVDPRPWFRCPFGAGHDEPELLASLHELGYVDVHWDVDPEDWREEQSAATVTARVVEGARAHGDGAVVLLHAWPRATVEAMPEILQILTGEGTQLVTVAAVMGGDAG